MKSDVDSQINQTKNNIPPNKKILIVDDQLFNINALIIVLEYKIKIDAQNLCDKATSGKAALQLIQENIQKNI